jgi:Tol biopolymer transport system component
MDTLGRRLAPALALIVVMLCGAAPAHATFPGKDGRIAFLGQDPIPPSLENPVATVNSDGTDLRYLTPGHSAVWSADGRYLASEDFGRIYVMKANGDEHRRVGPDEPWAIEPSWSPDGERLVVDGIDAIELVEIRGGRRTVIASQPFTAHPVWSPDGTRIAFASLLEHEIYTVHPDGTDLRNITHSPDEESGPLDWSPDSARIVFSSSTSGPRCTSGHYTMRADGSDRTPVWVANCAVPQPTPTWVTYKPSGELVLPGWDTENWQRAPIVTGPDGPIFGFRGAWQPLPEPRRGDYKNASAYCGALRGFLGAEEFARRFRNHGACVSRNH